MTALSGPDFITLLVRVLQTAYDFYKNKVGLTESPEKRPNAQAFRTKPCGFAIRQSPDAGKSPAPGQGVIVWFLAADSRVEYQRLKEQGVAIVEELRESPFGVTFSFRDPDGYVMSVHDGG